jgi:uncharacterized protein YutE (UPF0331/DUF86 family)
MVDGTLLAQGIADIRDAVRRIREVLPHSPDDFVRDRTTREVVALNLFVALQQCLSLATHWLADEGRRVPAGYRDVFLALADGSVLDAELAGRLAAAAGVRDLIAHRYGVLDWLRIHTIASSDLDDLLTFCARMALEADTGKP